MKALILNRETGEVREYADDEPRTTEFMWSDGNYGCDCNREVFFRAAKGEPDDDVGCGYGRFAVLGVWDEGGRVYAEDNDCNVVFAREGDA